MLAQPNTRGIMNEFYNRSANYGTQGSGQVFVIAVVVSEAWQRKLALLHLGSPPAHSFILNRTCDTQMRLLNTVAAKITKHMAVSHSTYLILQFSAHFRKVLLISFMKSHLVTEA